jgi:AbrB family looped-hinge helix DNA binding protein
VQKRGQITIPSDLRAEFGIEPGDQVAFVRTPDGILITTLEDQKVVRLRRLLAEMKSILQEQQEVDGKSYSLEELIESGRDIRGEILMEKHGLDVKA